MTLQWKIPAYTDKQQPADARAPRGPRGGFVGDSRSDNGLTSEGTSGMTTGVPENFRMQSIGAWALHKLGWPLEIVAQWTFGGSKTSESFNDHALNVMFARDIKWIWALVSTNDPVDYTGTGGLLPIPLGDPDADPATLPRVGDRKPTGTGLAAQGTTLGNWDKFLRACEAEGVTVFADEIPTENVGRRPTNRAVHLWLKEHAALGTYPNLVFLNIYPDLLEDPDMVNGPVADEVVRTDIETTVGTLRAAGDTAGFLHPSPAGARFLGESAADKPAVRNAIWHLSSRLLLPDGTNGASFINTNPTVAVGDGSGVLGYSGTSTPNPTGTVAQGYELGHAISTGTRAVAASFDGSGVQTITITRTGGASAGTVRVVELRGAAVNITPVAGDYYVIDSEVVAPARNPQDLYGVSSYIFLSEAGLVDDYGQNIANGTYGGFLAQNPNFFPKDGDTLISHGVPFEITPAMVASATGTIALVPRCQIAFDDTMDTTTNGALVVKIKSLGIRKLTRAEAHTTAPAAPATGPSFTAAPTIVGSPFVGGTLTLGNGTLSAGTVTNRRLLRDGVPVSFTGSNYTLTSADLGKTFVFEVTGTSGGIVIGSSDVFGPIANPSAELSTLITALSGVQNNAIFDFTDARIVSSTYRTEDYSGNGNPALQSSATRQPGISGTLGAVLDGSNDCMGYTWQSAAPTAITVALTMTKTAGDTSKRILSDGTTTNSAGQYQNAISALPGTWTVDGASVTTQGQLFTALEVAGEHTVMVTGLSMSGWPAIFFSRLTAAVLGSMRRGVVIDESTASLAAARTAATAWVQATT